MRAACIRSKGYAAWPCIYTLVPGQEACDLRTLKTKACHNRSSQCRSCSSYVCKVCYALFKGYIKQLWWGQRYQLGAAALELRLINMPQSILYEYVSW
jgi:hypothetical protein